MSRVTASLVVYRSSVEELEPVFRSMRRDASLRQWVVVDNGACEEPERAAAMRDAVVRHGGRYVRASENLGFGGGHNLALATLAATPAEFHLMVNPDIWFDGHVLPELCRVMDARPEMGLLMPRVLSPDGTDQRLCKLLPTPFDLALRRFATARMQVWCAPWMDRYCLRAMDIELPAEVPFLSGCFMFTRRAVLESIGGFDQGFFLYMEDLDLCRRLRAVSKLLYWPATAVTHVHARGSHKNMRMMWLHLRSAVTYFNKWGWFFDAERVRVNELALMRCREMTAKTRQVA